MKKNIIIHPLFLSQAVLEKYNDKIEDIIDKNDFKSDRVYVSYYENIKSIVIGDITYDENEFYEKSFYCNLYQFENEEDYCLYEEMVEKIKKQKKEIEIIEGILKNDSITLKLYETHKNRIFNEIKSWFDNHLIISQNDILMFLTDENRIIDIIDIYDKNDFDFYKINEFELYFIALDELVNDSYCTKLLKNEEDDTYFKYDRHLIDDYLTVYCKILENDEITFEDFFDSKY